MPWPVPGPGRSVRLEEFLGDWAARTVIVPGNHDVRWEEPDIDDRLSAWRGFARDRLKRKVVGLPDHPFAQVAAAVAAAGELASLAGRLETTPAALALAFPLTNPAVTSALFGATSSEQVRANCAAISLLDRLGPADLADLRHIGRPEYRIPAADTAQALKASRDLPRGYHC